ncbi:hypothetical protein [Mangrovactinospora gilvigrisea]|uniref:hypothetical protein n=1 Tax=Mangrovactinospora gilvigrisea TaxID=1428644 RepID=UPI000A91318A|nr:hypothetical protein [Mangrovactinospora gilvigrisea]
MAKWREVRKGVINTSAELTDEQVDRAVRADGGLDPLKTHDDGKVTRLGRVFAKVPHS